MADNQFTTLDQQNAQYCSLDIYITLSHWKFLHVAIPKGSSTGDQMKVTPRKNKLATFA
jgi:hypothetical protein